MTEPTPRSDTGPDTPPGMPRWVKVAAIVVGVLFLLFVVLQLTGIGGEHGPGRHMSGLVPTSDISVTEDHALTAATVR